MEKLGRTMVLMNHNLGETQIEEIKNKGGEIVQTPEFIKDLWRDIGPEWSTAEVKGALGMPILSCILEQKINAIVLAGELSACLLIHSILEKENVAVLIATSKRVSVETVNPDGSVSKSNVFKHVQFRRI